MGVYAWPHFTAIGFLILAIACAATAPKHPYEVDPAFEGAPNAERVLLAPINAFGGIAEVLRDGAARTREETKRYLALHGKKVVSVSLFDFRRAASALPAKDEQADDEPRVRELFARLREEHDFDVLVLASVLMRTARLTGGRMARWDGVRRQMSAPGGMTWSGATSAASLQVRVYDERGVRVFMGIGGLDHVFRADVSEKRFVVLDDPLSDREALREGIAIAFHPFVPILP